MVDALVAAGAPATLFVQGGWVEGRATDDEIAALHEDGMVVGLHGHTHRRFTELSGSEIAEELACSEGALNARGIDPVRPLFRLPYLAGNTDRKLLDVVRAHGWEHVDCHAIAYDWLGELRDDPAAVALHAVNGINARRAAGAGCAIVLLHSWPDPAPAAVHMLVEHARDHDDELVAVTDVPRHEWDAEP